MTGDDDSLCPVSLLFPTPLAMARGGTVGVWEPHSEGLVSKR